MREIKGVIFDLDGTLLDSLEDVANFANAVLLMYGFETRTKEEYRYLAGQGAYNLMAASSGSSDEALIERMAFEFATVHAEVDGSSKAFEGIDAVLAALEQKNIKKAVLSNKPEHLTKACVAKHFREYCFEAVCGQREGVAVKPNPTLAYEIADIFGLNTSEIAIVGDSKNDILVAKNGGFYAIGVTWGFRDMDELVSYGADVVVSSPSELLGLFGIV